MFNVILQASPAAGPSPIASFLPFVLIILVFYFFIIRPQNKRLKDHRALLASITRGDVIVTNGGLIGKVKKVTDDELTVDFSGQDIKVVRNMIADVRNRTVPANDTAKPGKK